MIAKGWNCERFTTRFAGGTETRREQKKRNPVLRAFRPRSPVDKIPATCLNGEPRGGADYRPQLTCRAPRCGARPHAVRPYRRGDANALPIRTERSKRRVQTKGAKSMNVVPKEAARICLSLRSSRLLLINSFSWNDSRTGCGNFGHGIPRGRNARNIIFSLHSSPCFRASSEAGGESFLPSNILEKPS